ncbi:hypothetical protein OIDMADRAFT_55286 [Oidiodendron maius Zn]|uniref:Uncharacterized protein n=1 Tax=Oidiodendron maius (strain Zn) TaxID=913774 RepID=A0A0C3DFH8_OIDMZ|nr:hypothetical protein OIDMADRAFT_55286 [Oidiodendron maius Zn]
MVNIQTIVFALVAGLAGAKNLKVRGTTNVFTRDEVALDKEFAACEAAIKAQGKPTVTQQSDTVFIVTNYPAVCAEEAQAFKPVGNTTMVVSNNQIIITNAPGGFISTIEE